MINLSVQDSIDGKGKVTELRAAIGQEFSYYKSGTGRAKLMAVHEDGNQCTVQEVKAHGREPKIMKVTAPSWLIWNCMFF